MFTFRPYDHDRDRHDAHRIWRECGWIEPGKAEHEAAMDAFIATSPGLVAELDGHAECLVVREPGMMRYLDEDLPFSAVAAVTVSHVARRRGVATRLTARLVADQAADGAIVSGLGMFDQGFYDKLGYGAGPYERDILLDPALFRVPAPSRPPRRFTIDDAERLHANRLARPRSHGMVMFPNANTTRAERMWDPGKQFCLGYEGPDGRITHHVVFGAENLGEGPYRVGWFGYETYAQFIELLGVLAGLGDQVKLIHVPQEPAGIQLQDFMERPHYRRSIGDKGRFASGSYCMAHWQARMLDVPACHARTHLPGEAVRFNLRLADPIAERLDDDAPWRGAGGDYVVTLGPESQAKPGSDAALPTLDATVNAYTRMWLGVRPPSGLAATDTLSAPPELLAALDRLLRIPEPHPEWMY